MGFLWASLDESADRQRRKVFVVAGYLARQASWTEIERQWMLRLEQECDPQPMKYFSSNECICLNGEFRRFRKYPAAKGRQAADAVRDDLRQILRSADAVGFGMGVNMKDYRAVRRSSRARLTLHTDPYEQTYVTMLINIAAACQDDMPHLVNMETVAFLCDEHDRAVNVKNVYDKLKASNPRCEPWMGSLAFMDNEKSPAIQAADLLASGCRQFLVETIDHPGQEAHARLLEQWKPILGRNVGIKCMDKRSLSLCVDANVPRKGTGKLSIYSTQQPSLFGNLLTSDKP